MSNAQQVQGNFPVMWSLAVLEKVDALPGTQRKLALNDGYRQMHARKCRAQVSGHIVGTLVVMLVSTSPLPKSHRPCSALTVRETAGLSAKGQPTDVD